MSTNNTNTKTNITGDHDHEEKDCKCGWEEIHCKCGWVTGWAKKTGGGYDVKMGSADFVKKEFADGNWYVQCNVCAEKEEDEACSVCGEDTAEHEYGGEAEKCFITHHECCVCKDYYDELNDDGECPSCGHWDGRMDNGKNGKYK